MKVYEESSSLRVDRNTELEIIRYYTERSSPTIVFATGLGGCAGKFCWTDYLAKEYNIFTFSPRNSGSSNGHLTIGNYVSDISIIIDHLSQTEGRKPFGIGHSTGGYSLAYLMRESPLVEKAVLVAPLIKMDEQNPQLVNNYLSFCIKRNEFFLPGFLKDRTFHVDKQRFDSGDIVPFLKSIYESPPCNKKLLSPTKVFLAGGTCFRLPMSNKGLRGLEDSWRDLGAEVKVYQWLNHWFSGSRWFSGIGDPFSLFEKEGITGEIYDFFKSNR